MKEVLPETPELRATAAARGGARVRSSIVWLLALIASVVGLLQIYLIATSYNRQIGEAQRLAETLARVVEDQTNRSLQSILLVLDATERELESGGRFGANTRARLRSVPEIRGLYVVGADGKVTDSTISAADIGHDEGMRDFVKALRDAPENVAIGKPLLRRSPAGAEIPALAFLPVAARLGRSGAVVVAAVNISFLELQYRALLGSTSAAVVLTTFKGDVIVDSSRAWPVAASVAGSDPVFTQFLPGREVGTFSRDAIDGRRPEIVSFRVTRGFPVVVSLAVSKDSIRADWADASLPNLLASLIAFALVLVALWYLMRQFRVIQEQERNLMRSRDAAEAANRAKSQFLAVMSHEIRTPMNAVLGMASALLDERLHPEQRKSVQAIHDAGDALLVILNDILDYTRLESGQLAIESVPFDPRTIVERAMAIMGPRASAKGLAIDATGMEALPAGVRGDAVRLTQVLLNVLGNAVKFTERGGISVSVSAAAVDEQRVELAWRVIDTGIGIPAERLGSLFQEFVQADASIHRRFGGSGLGLAICKRLVEQMQGRIDVVSTVGKGTTITFSVPLELAPAAESAESGDPASRLEALLAGLGRPFRTLVVDDNATNRVVADKMLRTLGVEVDFAEDGTEAVEKAGRSVFDLILMDMRMPRMDGPAAARLIRAGGGPNARTPIVAFTANAFPEDVELCRQAGMEHVVPKPVRKRGLVAALEAALAQKEEAGQTAGTPAAVVRPVEAGNVPAAFDPRVSEDLAREIGHETMAEAFGLFAAETETRLARMRALDPARPLDLEVIGREAHTLKGDAGSFGLLHAHACALAIEKAARGGSLADYQAQLVALKAALDAGLAQMPRPAEAA